MAKLILTGDVNLMNVTDPATPFTRVAEEFRAADMVFSNLECCLYTPPVAQSFHNEGFFADPTVGAAALRGAAIAAVGIANNVNYGEAAILSSLSHLDAAGIPHTGAGANLAAAKAPVVLERGGIRFGFLQRSSVYWSTNHEAGPHDPGIAVIRGNTAYQVPMHKTRPEIPPMNRPGIPPIIVTWAEPDHLAAFRDDIGALRAQADIVVASCHWGLGKDVLQYMRDIAHAAIGRIGSSRCRAAPRDGSAPYRPARRSPSEAPRCRPTPDGTAVRRPLRRTPGPCRQDRSSAAENAVSAARHIGWENPGAN